MWGRRAHFFLIECIQRDQCSKIKDSLLWNAVYFGLYYFHYLSVKFIVFFLSYGNGIILSTQFSCQVCSFQSESSLKCMQILFFKKMYQTCQVVFSHYLSLLVSFSHFHFLCATQTDSHSLFIPYTLYKQVIFLIIVILLNYCVCL